MHDIERLTLALVVLSAHAPSRTTSAPCAPVPWPISAIRPEPGQSRGGLSPRSSGIAHDGLEHVVPVSAVHVAGTQSTAFEVAKLIEHEQRVIAGAGVMAVPDAHLLLAVGRAHA